MPLDKGFDYFYGIPASLNFWHSAWFEGRRVSDALMSPVRKEPEAHGLSHHATLSKKVALNCA
jgi:hypothetical protein